MQRGKKNSQTTILPWHIANPVAGRREGATTSRTRQTTLYLDAVDVVISRTTISVLGKSECRAGSLSGSNLQTLHPPRFLPRCEEISVRPSVRPSHA